MMRTRFSSITRKGLSARALVLGLSALIMLGTVPAIAQPAAANPAPSAGAATAQTGDAANPETVRRLRALSDELRCLVCQNQTLADSHAELAVDLRRQVESMIARGDDDAQIKRYLVDRYGDFVLYRPPVQRNTALLWFGPFALLLVGAIAWVLIQRRSRRAAAPVAIDPADQARVRKLLED